MTKWQIILIIIIISILVFYNSHTCVASQKEKSSQKEGIATGINLPGGNDKAVLDSIDNLKDFLEKLYFICILNENDVNTNKIQQTVCYKINILATYLPDILGNIIDTPMDILSERFGYRDTSVMGMNIKAGPVPPPPIIGNNQDYIMFLFLCMSGRMLKPYIDCKIWTRTPDPSDNNKTIITDMTNSTNINDIELVKCATFIFEDIKTTLAYFHNQVDKMDTSPGDTYDTVQ